MNLKPISAIQKHDKESPKKFKNSRKLLSKSNVVNSERIETSARADINNTSKISEYWQAYETGNDSKKQRELSEYFNKKNKFVK